MRKNKTLNNFKKRRSYLFSGYIDILNHMGKITVVKSLATRILIQSLTILPNLQIDKTKQFKIIFLVFRDLENQIRLKQKYEKSLGMTDIEYFSFFFVIKTKRINKLFNLF